MRRTFPAAGNRVGGSDAFVSRIANSEARQVTTDEDRRLNYGCRFDVARECTHRPALISRTTSNIKWIAFLRALYAEVK